MGRMGMGVALQRVNFYLPVQDYVGLQTLGGYRGMTMSDHIRKAIRIYLEEESNKKNSKKDDLNIGDKE